MNPYENLPPEAFWKTAVASRHPFDIAGLWLPKCNIAPEDQVSTYGSCFAQHIGRSLKKRGYGWMITEKAPIGLSAENLTKFNYELFSSRTANIYTPSLLKQWVGWALEDKPVPSEIWEQDGRFYDPFRPTIEPGGFESADELNRCREHTISCFRKSVVDANHFVFTLGLTEHWVHGGGGFEYPLCPGTVAGEFDPTQHVFKNHGYQETREHLLQAISVMRSANPELRFLLTVSPVPLTATMSGNHVLAATMHSKSILRAVAGSLTEEFDFIDYFPSYEIINSPAFRGMFFEPNLRNVNPRGVEFVMDSFFKCLADKYGAAKVAKPKKNSRQEKDDAVCEEELLESFSRK